MTGFPKRSLNQDAQPSKDSSASDYRDSIHADKSSLRSQIIAISDFFSVSIKSKSHFNELQFYLLLLFYEHANYYNCSCHNQLTHFGLGNTQLLSPP